MQERVFFIVKKVFSSVRPLLLLFFSVSLVLAAAELNKTYTPEPLTPLTQVAKASTSVEVSYLKVSITGAVAKPGVYELTEGALLQTLLDKAGGLAKQADLAFVAKEINLAKVLTNSEQVYIPFLSETKVASTSGGSAQTSGSSTSKININSASITELDTLPGVGVATAEKIIAARPFAQLEDLKNVPGIGDATFSKLKDLISI